MSNFCPNCGTSIEQNYKFCPKCGNKVNFEAKEETYRGPAIICPNCGEENPAESYDCSACGIALKKGKKKRQPQSSAQRNTRQTSAVPVKKVLDITKLIAIFAGAIGIIFIVLIIAGVFEEKVPEQQTTTVNQPQSSGVDLAAIQRINDLQKQWESDPGNYEILLQLAHAENDGGFFQKATEHYSKYLEKNPANADARVDMGVCYFNLKEYDKAIAEMQKALQYQPKHQIAHLNLGIVNLAAGRVDESRKWLQKAEAIDPASDIGKRAAELLKNH